MEKSLAFYSQFVDISLKSLILLSSPFQWRLILLSLEPVELIRYAIYCSGFSENSHCYEGLDLIRITTFVWISASDLGLGYDFDCTYKLPSVDLLDSTVTSPISDIDILKSKKHQYSSNTVPLYSEDLRKGLLDTVYTNLLSSIVILKSKKYKYSSNILPLYNEDLRQGNLKTDETALIFLQNHSKLRNNHVYIFYKRKKLL